MCARCDINSITTAHYEYDYSGPTRARGKALSRIDKPISMRVVGRLSLMSCRPVWLPPLSRAGLKHAQITGSFVLMLWRVRFQGRLQVLVFAMRKAFHLVKLLSHHYEPHAPKAEGQTKGASSSYMHKRKKSLSVDKATHGS